MEDSEEENESVGVQDELKSGGIFQDLPWEILKMVLENLPMKEIKKTRRLSRWYEKRVTELFPSIFCNFNIKFLSDNNYDNAYTIATLDRAMRKPHYKSNTLKIQIKIEQNPLIKKMLISYQKSIVALDIHIYGDEDFLMKPGMKFDLLESLSVYIQNDYSNNKQIDQKNITEYLIVEHASKLKKLSVKDYHFIIDEIDVSALPCLESLTVHDFNPEMAWTLFRASKQTITSLNIKDIDINTQPTINNAGDENEADSIYQVPNLENLVIADGDGGEVSKLLINNANHLVSLTLWDVDLVSELPELPQLRELDISGVNYSLIIPKCKESLQCLAIYLDVRWSLDDFAVTQLKALYLANWHNCDVQCSKFLSHNHKSLEFILLRDADINNITLYDGIKLNRVKTVVLWTRDRLEGNEYTEEDRAMMAEFCPNAKILIWEEDKDIELRDFVMSNHRKMGFTTDLKGILESV